MMSDNLNRPKRKYRVILESSPLITLCSKSVGDLPLIEIFLQHTKVAITQEVELRVADRGRMRPDAALARRLIAQGRIAVREAPTTPLVNDYYTLDEKDCSVIRLACKYGRKVIPVLDEHRAFLAASHYLLRPMFLLDLLLRMVYEGSLSATLAEAMVRSCVERYPGPHVQHVLGQLEDWQ